MAKATALIAAALVAVLAGCSSSAGEFDKYTQRCHDKGGIVTHDALAETRDPSIASRYMCIGDGPAPLLPGFSF